MRTKTLLAAAALAVGMVASQAQTYSANVVGYINVTCAPGLTMIANQLIQTNSTVDAIMPLDLPENCQLLTWGGAGFNINTYYGNGNGWDDGTMQLTPGMGAFFNNVQSTNIVLTFVGEVPQGNLTNTISAGLNLISSIVPQAGNLETQLGLAPLTANDTVLTWGGAGYDINTYYDVGTWDADPIVNVGQSFFFNAQTAGNWVRTFTVN